MIIRTVAPRKNTCPECGWPAAGRVHPTRPEHLLVVKARRFLLDGRRTAHTPSFANGVLESRERVGLSISAARWFDLITVPPADFKHPVLDWRGIVSGTSAIVQSVGVLPSWWGRIFRLLQYLSPSRIREARESGHLPRSCRSFDSVEGILWRKAEARPQWRSALLTATLMLPGTRARNDHLLENLWGTGQ